MNAGPHDDRETEPRVAPRILICDDELSIRAIVERRLRAAGFCVVATRNGEDALEKVRQESFDVLVTDHRMPRLSGITLCTLVREELAEAAPRSILLTAQGHTISDQEYRNAGVARIVQKPFSPVRLVKLIDELIDRTTTGEIAA
jgi:DNA-binding response OmpR family regulator